MKYKSLKILNIYFINNNYLFIKVISLKLFSKYAIFSLTLILIKDSSGLLIFLNKIYLNRNNFIYLLIKIDLFIIYDL